MPGWVLFEVREVLFVASALCREHAEAQLLLGCGDRAPKSRGFLVRWVPGQGLPQGLRMTIGTEEETRGLAAALREIVGAG